MLQDNSGAEPCHVAPVLDESVNFDTTENLIIEGDNLEVLKLLQKSYLGKVKMIYIDPPYNTGNDFIYPDNYAESLQTYLEYTGQVDSEGRKFGRKSRSMSRTAMTYSSGPMSGPPMLKAIPLQRSMRSQTPSLSGLRTGLRFVSVRKWAECATMCGAYKSAIP